MEYLISNAWAQAAAPAGPGLELFIMIGIFFLIMYFLIIRPQSKRNKEHKQLLASLSKGDEVVTSGGLLGKVSDIGDSFISLEVQDGIVIKIQKQSVSAVMPKGTLKN